MTGSHPVGQRPVAAPEQSIDLDMQHVASLSAALAKRRGYSDDMAASIARHVVFLERRGLPGLANLYSEMVSFHAEPLVSRFALRRPDGRAGGHCPFHAGMEHARSFEMLTDCSPEERRWATAPSHSLLLVPRLAERLRPTGRRAIVWWAKDKDVPGFIVVEGFRLELISKLGRADALDTLRQAEHIGFSDCPEDFEPRPQPRSGFRTSVAIQARHIAWIQDYLEASQ